MDPVSASPSSLLRAFFEGYGLSAGPELDRLVARASSREAAESLVQAWFARVLPGVPPVSARAAWLGCGGPARWPDAFLAQAPASLTAALAAALPPSLPPAATLAMPAQSLAPVRWFGRLRHVFAEAELPLGSSDPT